MNLPPVVPISWRCTICLIKLRRRWYRCLRCHNFRICSLCYDKELNWGVHHMLTHPLQRVLNKEAEGMTFYDQDGLASSGTYTCPYCCKMGHTRKTLQEHLYEHHRDNEDFVNCPICLASPYNVDSFSMQNLLGHITYFPCQDVKNAYRGDQSPGGSNSSGASIFSTESNSSEASNFSTESCIFRASNEFNHVLPYA